VGHEGSRAFFVTFLAPAGRLSSAWPDVVFAEMLYSPGQSPAQPRHSQPPSTSSNTTCPVFGR
jgi:hypothetical protein